MATVQIYDDINQNSEGLSRGLSNYGYISSIVSELSSGYDFSILGDKFNFSNGDISQCSSSRILCVRSIVSSRNEDRIRSIKFKSLGYYEYPISSYLIANELDRISSSSVVQSPSVLIVCDNDRRLSYYRNKLPSSSIIYVLSNNSSEGLSISSSVQCVVLDYSNRDVYDLMFAIRQSSQVPIVLLRDSIRLEDRVRISSIIGIVQMPKFISIGVLESSIRGVLSSQSKLSIVEVTDPLSSHYTWGSMEVFINHEISRHVRSINISLSIGILEIDHHSDIIRDHGEYISNEVLKSLGGLLRRTLRKSDICSRYNSSRYVVLMPLTSYHQGVQLFNRIRNEWARITHSSLVSNFNSTISGSVVEYSSNQTYLQYIESLFKSLVQVKLSGGNRVG